MSTWELTNVTATDSQSLLAVMHNTLYPDPVSRPAKASAAVRLASYSLGAAMTLLTLLAAGRRAKVLGRNQLDGGCMATPAIAGKALYVRTKTHLYRIEQGS